jgi:hypothetical protein
MTGLIQEFTDAEKTFGFLAALHGQLSDIKDILNDDNFKLDMWGDDPGGVYGVIGALQSSAPLLRTFNGPYIIESILATWGIAPATIQANGQVAAPAANTSICSTVTIPAGTYTVNWTVELEGTLAVGTDDNNFKIGLLGTEVSVNPAIAGVYPQAPFEVTFPAAGGNITVRNNLAGTAGSIYRAQVTIDGVNTVATLQLGPRTIQLASGGGLFNPNDLYIEMDHDDQVIMTVLPAQPCHLEIMGHADNRRRQAIKGK